MWRTAAVLALIPLLLPAETVDQLTADEKKDGWVLLFNGGNLEGWEGNPALWSVADGCIVGSTEGHPIGHNTFLVGKKEYSDFILKVEMRLRNHNSGVQFRSAALPDWVMQGYQADASEMGDRSGWGNLYDEKGHGRKLMRTEDEGWQIAKKVVRSGGWNEYEILAQGDHIRLKLNGTVTMDLRGMTVPKGVFGFQLHMGPPMKVEFRNIKVKPLERN